MKKSFPVVLASTVVASTLVSQCTIAKEGSMTGMECTVARVAERHIAVSYPEFDSLKNPPVVQDKGGSWGVYYELPKEAIGGTPVVVIEKATLKVLRSFHTQ
jgi:hypothetical protein